MFFFIEPNNGVAIYEQIIRQVKFAIADRTLLPGQLIPSVRLLSQNLAVNGNTIQRALQQLQSEGVLESVRGRGLAVCAEATPVCIASRRQLLSDRFRSVIAEALHAGLEAVEIREIVRQQLIALVGSVETISATSANTTIAAGDVTAASKP